MNMRSAIKMPLSLVLLLSCLSMHSNVQASSALSQLKSSGKPAAIQSYELYPKRVEGEVEKSAGEEVLAKAVIESYPEQQLPINKEQGTVGGAVETSNIPFTPKLIPNYLDILSQLLVFGEKIWKIVEDNAAVLSIDNRAISVLPNILNQNVTPMDLENWQLPITKGYHFTGLSNFGNVLADMNYTLQFSFGGSNAGKGQYLAGVNIVPSKVYVKWSNKFEVKSELKSVINLSTKENPVVAATVELTFKLSTPFSTRVMTDTITVVGDGKVLFPVQNNSVPSEALIGAPPISDPADAGPEVID